MLDVEGGDVDIGADDEEVELVVTCWWRAAPSLQAVERVRLRMTWTVRVPALAPEEWWMLMPLDAEAEER